MTETTPSTVAAPVATAQGGLMAGMSGRERIIAGVIIAALSGGAGMGGGSLFGDGGKAAAVASAKLDAKLDALVTKVDALDKRLGLTEKKNNGIARKVSWIAGKLGMPPEPEGSP